MNSWTLMLMVALAPLAVVALVWLLYMAIERAGLLSGSSLVVPVRPLTRVVTVAAIAWCGVTVAFTGVSPQLTVWLGGAVVATAAWRLVTIVDRPALVFDDVAFETELRALLDEAV